MMDVEIVRLCAEYEKSWDLPPLSVIDFVQGLLDDGWSISRSRVDTVGIHKYMVRDVPGGAQ